MSLVMSSGVSCSSELSGLAHIRRHEGCPYVSCCGDFVEFTSSHPTSAFRVLGKRQFLFLLIPSQKSGRKLKISISVGGLGAERTFF